MSFGVILRGLLQSTPRSQREAALTAWLQTLVTESGSNWAGYWDIAAPAGAFQPNGQPAINQGDTVHRIPNLLPGTALGDWQFDAAGLEAMIGMPLPPGRTSTAVIDRSITYGNGQQYPKVPMCRVPPGLWNPAEEAMVNLINTFTLFALTTAPMPPASLRGVTQVYITSFVLHELANMGTGSPIPVDGIPPAMALAPAVVIVTMDFQTAEVLAFANGVPFDVGDATGGAGPVNPTPEDLAGMLQQIGMMWGTPCTSAQKAAILPFPLTVQDIPFVTDAFASAMEA